MQVFKHPFSIRGLTVEKVDNETDQWAAQEIVAFVSTHLSERSINPYFGINDPSFGHRNSKGESHDPNAFELYDAVQFVTDFNSFYPDIEITEIDLGAKAGALSEIKIAFSYETRDLSTFFEV